MQATEDYTGSGIGDDAYSFGVMETESYLGITETNSLDQSGKMEM